MEFAQLGRSGLRVSRLCLGTLNFGVETGEPDSHRVMDRAHDAGINFFDTSDVYGSKDWRGDGTSEQIIGRWFAQGGGRRDRTVLSTKVYMPSSEWPNDGGLSALHIRRACEASLSRLQTDYIDVYHMHHVDRRTPWDEIWEAMSVLRSQGKIVYVGSSNFAGWQIATAQGIARARHFVGLVSEQSIYNLLTRDLEREVIPAAQYHGIGVLAWSPLHRGLLGGVLGLARGGNALAAARFPEAHLEAYRHQIERYEVLCDQMGAAPSQVALAWLLSRPGLTAPVIGPASAEQLADAVKAVELHLTDDALTQLDIIFPGYKTAPEDYAW
jgi:NDP-hexose C3-ketoreductase / dTDP-4-oxo-2-deoxy-alpha-D-pentos-2-ene 2,3-reductase